MYSLHTMVGKTGGQTRMSLLPTDYNAVMACEAQARGAVCIVGICAQRDQAKGTLLQEVGCTVASEWHVRLL